MEDFARSNKDHNHHQIVIRGKRTKRHRPVVSALAAVISGEDDRYGSTSSPTTSGDQVYESEEEDMANCLILLAQGGAAVEKRIGEPSKERHNSRKFTEIMAATATAADAAGKVGFYVYECKTCNRTFPSFQALGGHRASHKKPRTAEEKKSPVTAAAVTVSIPTVQSSTVVDDHRPLSLQFAKSNFQICNNNNNNNNSKISKVHECSICGSEFTSGQALGGHMRRHRTAVAAAASATTVTSTDISSRNNILQLDLNLPAPEDDLRESSTSSSSSTQFQFASAKQSIVFSAPALVDCHY